MTNIEFEDADRLEFLWKQHSYIADFIKFADAKAGLNATLSLASLTVILSPASKLRILAAPHLIGFTTFWQACASMAFIAYIISLACTVIVVFPRLPTGPGIAPISWVEISNFRNCETFVKTFKELRLESAVRLMTVQNFHMARVCRAKNRWVQRAISFFIIGSVVSLIICNS